MSDRVDRYSTVFCPPIKIVYVDFPKIRRSGEKLPVHTSPPLLKNPNPAESSGSLKETYDAKLLLDTGPSSRNKPNTAETYESLAEVCGAKLSLDTGSPSQEKHNTAEPYESLAEVYGAILPSDTGSPSQEKHNTAEPYESLAEVYGAIIPLETAPPSQNKPNATKPYEPLAEVSGKKVPMDDRKLNGDYRDYFPPNDMTRFGKKVPKDNRKLKSDEYFDYFPHHYVIRNGIKFHTEVVRPKKRKKPKAIAKKDNKRYGKKREDLEDAVFREYEPMETLSRQFASAALSYLHKQGHNLELVKPGLYEFGKLPVALRVHFNFKAKRKDVPGAPVETYFGQLRYYGNTDMYVECCVSVGESDSLPYDRDNRGCGYCTKFVHHPLGGCKGIIWGLLTYSRKLDNYIYT